MSQAIRFQRQNPALFDHVMAADENSGFYKRVARGKDLRRYIAYRDRVINTQNVTMNAIGLRDVNTSDLKTIDGQLALAIQNARLKSGELYKDALELPTILAKLPIKDQWILMRAINSK
jgi:hypothetical protein